MKKFSHLRYMIGNDPFVDWALIFASSVFVAIVAVIVGVYVYAGGAASLASTPPIAESENQAAHFDAAELTTITAAFDARAAERVLLTRGYSGPSDPSLP